MREYLGEKKCFNSVCEQHTCADNTCILERYGKFIYANTYGQKYKFRFIACLKYHLTILSWKLRSW